MPIPLDDLVLLDSADLGVYMKPQPVEAARGDLLVSMAVELVREAVFPRTTVPASAKGIVLEAAARAYRPRVQQESLGSRSVSYFPVGDPRSGVFLTEDELAQLGVAGTGVGVIWTRSPGGAVR